MCIRDSSLSLSLFKEPLDTETSCKTIQKIPFIFIKVFRSYTSSVTLAVSLFCAEENSTVEERLLYANFEPIFKNILMCIYKIMKLIQIIELQNLESYKKITSYV